MNSTLHKVYFLIVAVALSAVLGGCSRGTRSESYDERTRNPGSANEPKNTGDTRAKTLEDGKSPSASPTGLSKDARPDETPPGASGPGIDPNKGR